MAKFLGSAKCTDFGPDPRIRTVSQLDLVSLNLHKPYWELNTFWKLEFQCLAHLKVLFIKNVESLYAEILLIEWIEHFATVRCYYYCKLFQNMEVQLRTVFQLRETNKYKIKHMKINNSEQTQKLINLKIIHY